MAAQAVQLAQPVGYEPTDSTLQPEAVVEAGADLLQLQMALVMRPQ